MRRVPFDEQEITINVYPVQASGYADVFCSIPHWTRRLKKLAQTHQDVEFRETDDGIMMRVPSDWIKIKPPRHMNVDDAYRAAKSEAIRKYNEARKEEAQHG